MHTYSKIVGVWVVGLFKPDGHWSPVKDFASEAEAAAYAAYLNGGAEPKQVHPLDQKTP